MANEKIKALFAEAKKLIMGFSLDGEPAAGDMQPADTLKAYITDSGSTVKIDKLEVGGKVFNEDGTTPVTSAVTLSDGTMVAVDETGAITEVTAPVAAGAEDTTPPDMAAMQAMTEKFASGTPEDRIANLETVSKAVMQYCYGWKMDESNRKAIEDQAIAAYKTIGVPQQFSDQITGLQKQLNEEKEGRKVDAQKFSEALNKVVSIMEQFAAEPSADPAQVPSGSAPITKHERAKVLLDSIRK